MNKYLKKQTDIMETERRIKISGDREIRQTDSDKMKNLLRRAVEKEFVPQKLIDTIRQKIRREI